MSEPIVVGTDGSAAADRAVEWAAAEAELRHRPLHIVHAAEAWPYTAPLFAPAESITLINRADRAVLARAEERARDRRPDVEVTTELLVKPTGPALREQSEGAFELVLGHRGRGGFSSLLLGSVGLRLAGHAAGPVVIVRGDVPREQGEVVVGVDPARDPEDALRYAFEAASLRGGRLRVVHAWHLSATALEAGYSPDTGHLVESLRWRVLKAHAPLRKRYPEVEVNDDVVMDHPVAALCEASRTAALLVVGAHERRLPVGPALGSVSHGVLHHAHCPVAIARER